MTEEETFKGWVADQINSKEFEGYWDHRRKGPLGKKGRETWINGKTGLADISVSKHGSGIDSYYSAKISIPVTSTYERKTFIGIGNEHKKESWSTTYKYHVTYNRGFITNRLENESFTDSSTSADHDAVEWSQEELKNDIFLNLTNKS